MPDPARTAAVGTARVSSAGRHRFGEFGAKTPTVTSALGSTDRTAVRIWSIQNRTPSLSIRALSPARPMSYFLPLAVVTVPDRSENGGLSEKYQSSPRKPYAR